jgi:hypothetical protein
VDPAPGGRAAGRKSLRDVDRELSPERIREQLGDGSFGGPYAHADEDLLRIWRAGVEEIRDLLECGWD